MPEQPGVTKHDPDWPPLPAAVLRAMQRLRAEIGAHPAIKERLLEVQRALQTAGEPLSKLMVAVQVKENRYVVALQEAVD